jgi:hypothetical protein
MIHKQLRSRVFIKNNTEYSAVSHLNNCHLDPAH